MDSLLNAAADNRLLTVLAVMSFILLIVVTGGVIYLTAIEWRDKRRRGDAARAMPARGSSAGKGVAKTKRK
ncbi:MAG: hypothetical protein AAFQ63_04725 [Cyanobacteria bacterium J06621_11]